MRAEKLTSYLWGQITEHVGRFFTREAADHIAGEKIRFLPFQDALATREPSIVIPVDIQSPPLPQPAESVPFGESKIKLYNPIPSPPGNGEEWQLWPSKSQPVWYRHQSGTLMPTWNLYRNLLDLLTHEEEQGCSRRDNHGRYLAEFSPRLAANLLEVPHFNDSVALLVSGAASLSGDNSRSESLVGLVRSPVIVLSHDCDVLLGNDFWTQAVRGYRGLAPLKNFQLPALANYWWIVRNACRPRSYYFDNVRGMIELEQIYGYHSSLYLINGTGGRFGARSGEDILSEAIKLVEPPWETGLHYNFDTHLDPDKFREQKHALQALTANSIVSGRAHYLRFDPMRSYEIWDEHGIRFDESVGFSDRIGYRCGIGGCFRPLNREVEGAMGLVELPLVVMDKVLVDQFGPDAVTVFARLLTHLKSVGGALTLVFHPGQFFNPEHKKMLGVYNRLLSECHRVGAVSETARTLAGRVRVGKA